MTLLAAILLSAAPAPLKVGVTLHPYYSWASNLAEGLPVEVRAVLPGDVDVDSYQPRPEDVARLADLDALIINGVGHDDFIMGMLRASGNTRCRLIRPSDATAVLRSAHGNGANPHTFLSLSNAIQQTYLISRELGELRPELRAGLQHNAETYVTRLRALRGQAVTRFARAKEHRVVTVHDGYAYLLLELGLEQAAVVEPAHGLVPSAAELSKVLATVHAGGVRVVLSEASFPPALSEAMKQAGATVSVISHIATGPFTASRFEDEMTANISALAAAVEAP